MSILVSVDLGTTTITSLALDAASGEVLACRTEFNSSETTSAGDKARGRSECDAAEMIRLAAQCIRHVAGQIAGRQPCLGIGITGQQHGVVIVDDELRPITPFVGWQDRRGNDTFAGTTHSLVDEAR